MSGFKWQRVYFSMAATPLDAADIVFAQLAFIAFRVFTACGVFLLVMAAFGALHDLVGAVLALGVVVAARAGPRRPGRRAERADEERDRLRADLPARPDADVPLQRRVLPDLAARPASPGSPT